MLLCAPLEAADAKNAHTCKKHRFALQAIHQQNHHLTRAHMHTGPWQIVEQVGAQVRTFILNPDIMDILFKQRRYRLHCAIFGHF